MKTIGQLWSANHIKSNVISVVNASLSNGTNVAVNGILLPSNWGDYDDEDHFLVKIDDENKDWLPMFNSIVDANRVFGKLREDLTLDFGGSFGFIFDRNANRIYFYSRYLPDEPHEKYTSWAYLLGDFSLTSASLVKAVNNIDFSRVIHAPICVDASREFYSENGTSEDCWGWSGTGSTSVGAYKKAKAALEKIYGYKLSEAIFQ